MPEWERVKLGEVLTLRKEFITIDDTQTYKRCRAQWRAQGVILRDIIPGTSIKTKKQQVCRAGEFLVAEIDAKEGGFGIVPDTLNDSVVSSHYFLFQVDETLLDGEYLGYFTRTDGFMSQIKAQGSTNYSAVRPANIGGYEIPLPPLPEQRRIVARVKGLLEKVEEARRLRHMASEEAQLVWAAMGKDIFGSMGPCLPLSEVITLRGGGTPSKANPRFWNGDIPWVTPKDMKRRNITASQIQVTSEAIENSSARLVQPGAVLIVVRGMILAHTVPVAVLDMPSTINQDMKAMILDYRLLPEFLSAWMWAFNDAVLALVERSTHDTRKLETSKLLSLSIPVPSLNEQKEALFKLEANLDEVTKLRNYQKQTQQELDALPSAILAQAFAGAL